MTPSILSERRALLLLAGLVAVFYAPVIGFEFVFDDTSVIANNPRLRTFAGLRLLWTEDIWAFQTFKSPGNYFRPMLGAWLWTMWQLFGDQTVGWHVVNVLLHAGAACLTFTLGRRLGLTTFGALAGAALFALHPLAIQCGAWVIGVVDILIANLLLGACLLWLRGGRWRWLALLLLLTAMLVIERAFAFVGVLGLLILLRPEDPLAPRRVGLEALLLLIPLAAALGMRAAAGVSLGGGGDGPGHLEALWTAPVLATTYLQNALWPAELSLVYPVAFASTLSLKSLVLPVLVLAGALALCVGSRRRLFFLGCSVGLMVLPLDAALLPPGELVADRYAYGPLLFAGLLIGDLLDQLARVQGSRAAVATLLLLLTPLLVHHPSNLWSWQDNLSLYERAHAVVPGHPKFTMNLSNERRRRGLGDPDCALVRSAMQSITSGRMHGDKVVVAYNLGNCLRKSGAHEAALPMFRQAAEESSGVFHHARHNLAVTLLELGRIDEAWEQAGLLIQEAPGWPESWRLRAATNVKRGRIEQAVNCYVKLLELAPGDQDALSKLALLRGLPR